MFICAGLGIYNLKWITGSARLFILQAGLAGCMEILGTITASYAGNNHVYFNVYVVVEFLVILFAARDYLKGIFVQIAVAGSLIFGSVIVYDLVNMGPFYGSFHGYTTGWVVLGSAYLVVLLRQILQQTPVPKRGLSVIAVALITFYFCTIPRFGLMRYVIDSFSKSSTSMISIITFLFSMLRYVGTAIGLWIMARAARRLPEQRIPTTGRWGSGDPGPGAR